VAHELAKNLRVCFMQLLAVSTFTAGRRYTPEGTRREEWVLGLTEVRWRH
jgi:hypothetical protein